LLEYFSLPILVITFERANLVLPLVWETLHISADLEGFALALLFTFSC